MGRVFSIIITFLGVGMVAIPTDIISAGFVEQYQQFKKIGDYGIEQDIRFIRFPVTSKDKWAGRSIRNIGLPQGCLIAAVQRGQELIIPNGNVILTPGDIITVGAEPLSKELPVNLRQITLRKDHPWTNSAIRDIDISRQSYIVLVRHAGAALIPNGSTVLNEGDEVFVLSDRYYEGCMQARNRFMVDHSSLCFCYMTRFEGGTWATVRYALHQHLTVRNVAIRRDSTCVMKEYPWNSIYISRFAKENANTVRLFRFRLKKVKRINMSRRCLKRQD
jgi:Trk K+ transport system NAD-binding subunit